jgi:hypothetical protein
VLRPELEFIFRTLVEMRVDMDELRKEFETYREQLRGPAEILGPVRIRPGGAELHVAPAPLLGDAADRARVVERWEQSERRVGDLEEGRGEPASWSSTGIEPSEESTAQHLDVGTEGVVVFRPGMTMDDLEREAISAALERVSGNRRKAAEMLGIGERTLYRKIKKFELEGRG